MQHVQALTAGQDPNGVWRAPGEIFDIPDATPLGGWMVVVSGSFTNDASPVNPADGIINPESGNP